MYNVTVRKNMELDLVEAGNVVAQVLQEDFEFISKEINELQSRNDLKPFEAVDLANNIEIRHAMKTLLRYYMVHGDYTEFMELQRVYGHVV